MKGQPVVFSTAAQLSEQLSVDRHCLTDQSMTELMIDTWNSKCCRIAGFMYSHETSRRLDTKLRVLSYALLDVT